MIVQPFHHAETLARSYLLAHPTTGCALIIDPVLEQVDAYCEAIEVLRLKLLATVETHLHDDHVTGAFQLRARYGSRALFPTNLGAMGIDGELGHGDEIDLGLSTVRVLETPGQTAQAISLFVDGDGTLAVFTGDLTHAAGVPTPDDRGLYATQYASIREQLFTLPGSTVMYPGHDLADARFTKVATERAFNPFIGADRSFSRFVEVMEEASTRPHFTMADAARRNLLGGVLAADAKTVGRARALHRLEQFVGPRSVSLAWLCANQGSTQVVDFRHERLYREAHIFGSVLAGPSLAQVAREWSRSTDVVCIGQTEADCELLRKLGFDRLYRIDADPALWRAQGLPLANISSETHNLAVA